MSTTKPINELKFKDGTTYGIRRELEQQIASLQSELAQLRTELRNSQAESAQIRRNYLHEKVEREKAESELERARRLSEAATRLLHARSHTQACAFAGCTCGAAAEFRNALADFSRELQGQKKS